jgi:hypothetical protein
MNIKTTDNGFIFKDINYNFIECVYDNRIISNEIIFDNQLLIGTNEGLIFLDLTCSINDKFYTNINEFLKALNNKI